MGHSETSTVKARSASPHAAMGHRLPESGRDSDSSNVPGSIRRSPTHCATGTQTAFPTIFHRGVRPPGRGQAVDGRPVRGEALQPLGVADVWRAHQAVGHPDRGR